MNVEIKLQLSPLSLRLIGLVAVLLFCFLVANPGPVLAVLGPVLHMIFR